LVLAAAAALSACIQMGPIRGPQVAEPPKSACDLVVDFGGPTEVTHRPPSVPANGEYYGLQRTIGNTHGFVYECICLPGLDTSKAVASLAESDYRQKMFERRGTVKSVSWEDSPFGGKVLRGESVVDSMWGDVILRNNIYYAGQCTVNVSTLEVARSISQTRAASDQFLASLYRAGSAAPGMAITTGQGDVAERLKRLDDLRARGLISPDEYATRRKAIVDSL
jgi:hypothetical protein